MTILQWNVPPFPSPRMEPPATEVIDDAYLSPVSHGPLRSPAPPMRWIRGAVYDANGKLVKSSQKLGGVNGHNWVPADPGRIARGGLRERLDGTWLYGGHWIQHFGHFITETITTLWPQANVDGLVFHKYLKRPWSVESWQHELLELAGYGDLPVRVADGRTTYDIERLIVPSRSVVANGWAHDEADRVWNRIAGPIVTHSSSSGRAVFLSRTEFNRTRRSKGAKPARSSQVRDAKLDQAFAEAGYEVVSPETLPIRSQVALACEATTLAGASGSALHLAAFAQPGTRILECGDDRSPNQPLPMQLIIAQQRKQPHVFLARDVNVAQVMGILGKD